MAGEILLVESSPGAGGSNAGFCRKKGKEDPESGVAQKRSLWRTGRTQRIVSVAQGKAPVVGGSLRRGERERF